MTSEVCLALYPYYQTARLLMLQNLYLLHDPSFDEELRRAAIYITDRKVIFQSYWNLPTINLNVKIRQYLNQMETNKINQTAQYHLSMISSTQYLPMILKIKHKNKPTPADAAVDYVSYLLETESEEEHEGSRTSATDERSESDR